MQEATFGQAMELYERKVAMALRDAQKARESGDFDDAEYRASQASEFAEILAALYRAYDVTKGVY